MSRPYQQTLPDSWATYARVFTALGDEHRQRMLLMFERDESLTVSDIVRESPLSQTAVMHHIRVLRDANVLLATKRGRSVYLRPNVDLINEVMEAVINYIHEQL